MVRTEATLNSINLLSSLKKTKMAFFFLSYTECRIFSQTKKATEALRIKALAVFANSFPDGSSHKIVKNVL